VMSMRSLREVKKVAARENPSANGIVAATPGRSGLRLASVALLTSCPYSPDLRPPVGWWTLRRSLEGNGKAASVSALLRRRPPFRAVFAGCAFASPSRYWYGRQTCQANACIIIRLP
jgi:hypothetical protein